MPTLKYRLYEKIYRWALAGIRRATKNDFYFAPNTKSCITQHARYRYLERVHGIDFRQLNLEIAPPEVKRRIKDLGGNGRFQYKGLMYVILDGYIVTIYQPGGNKAFMTQETKNGRVWVF